MANGMFRGVPSGLVVTSGGNDMGHVGIAKAGEHCGFGYEEAAKLNPRLIYAVASGYGETGPLAQMAGQDWVKNVWAASKKWGFGVEGGYFQGGVVKGIYAGITASYSTDGMLDFLGDSVLSFKAGASANNWQPFKFVTEGLHEGIFSDWGTLKYRNGNSSQPYIEFTSSTEYVAHMMRNVITIPAALAYVAWGACNGF